MGRKTQQSHPVRKDWKSLEAKLQREAAASAEKAAAITPPEDAPVVISDPMEMSAVDDKPTKNLSIYSQSIADFLGFINESRVQFAMAKDLLEQSEREIRDLEHYIEIKDCDRSTKTKVMNKLKAARCNRRTAKDTIASTECILEWAINNEKSLHTLEQLLGKVRSVDSYISMRSYTMRSNVLSDICPEGVISSHD